ncbi:aminotransferase class V-fold PLP-dependent enzyme [Sulfolobales archaeon HS-7]|nr:aminotransferase class V-fold PLP-dependent enzyme [Sulfolobales archaeon HS-7]
MTRKLLMHVGPTTIDLDVLLAGVKESSGFTSEDFVYASKNVLYSMEEIVKAPPNSQSLIIPGSGTAAMESCVSLLNKDDKVLVISNGVFGNRWTSIFSRYPLKVETLESRPGEVVPLEEIAQKVEKNRYKMITFTHVETSTGVRLNIGDYAKAVRDFVDIIVVDGVSSIGGELVDMSGWGVDVYLTASQKALGAPPGAGLLVISPRALEVINHENLGGYFLNLSNWLPVMKSLKENVGGYFSTLPVHLIFSLSKAMELIRHEGVEKRIKRHELVARAIRGGVEGMGLEIVAKKGLYSNTVTGVLLKKADPVRLLEEIQSENVELAPGVHPALKGKYFRIGHMGWVTPNDAIATIGAIERTLRRLGEDIRIGEGVMAVQEILGA